MLALLLLGGRQGPRCGCRTPALAPALGSAIGERDHAGHRQPMPVLHGGVAHVAELRLSPGGLAVELAVGIASARMRVVFTLLAVEVGAAAVGAAVVLEVETLARPTPRSASRPPKNARPTTAA